MKVSHPTNRAQSQSEVPREIPKWARRYAKHRSVPFLVSQAFFVLFAIAIGVSSYLAALAYRVGQMLGFWICLSVLAAVIMALVWYCARGDKLIQRLSLRFYLEEGSAALDSSLTKKQKRLVSAVVSLFLLCIAGSIALSVLGYLPAKKYMQPISAIYCVPFLVFMSVSLRRRIGLLSLLWPILYGLHAILVVAGAPILFRGPWSALNMLIPVAGYGMVAALAAHIYSRFALRKLKKLANVPTEAGSIEGGR